MTGNAETTREWVDVQQRFLRLTNPQAQTEPQCQREPALAQEGSGALYVPFGAMRYCVQDKNLTGNERWEPIQIDLVNSPIDDQVPSDGKKNQDVDSCIQRSECHKWWRESTESRRSQGATSHQLQTTMKLGLSTQTDRQRKGDRERSNIEKRNQQIRRGMALGQI